MKRQKEFLEVHGNLVKSGKINGLKQIITVPERPHTRTNYISRIKEEEVYDFNLYKSIFNF